MKRWLCLLSLALAACNQPPTPTASAPTSAPSPATPVATAPQELPIKIRVNGRQTYIEVTSLVTDLQVEAITVNEGQCPLFGQGPDDLRGFDPASPEGKATGLPADMLTQGKTDLLAQLPPFALKMGQQRRLQYDPCNPVKITFKTNHGSVTWRADA